MSSEGSASSAVSALSQQWVYEDRFVADVSEARSATSASQLWSFYLDRLKSSGDVLELSAYGDSADMAASGVDYLFQCLASAYLLCGRLDPNYPEFVPLTNMVVNLGAPSPDVTYYFARIDGRGNYRVSGHRGTVYAIDLQTGYDFVGFGDKPGETFPSKRVSDGKFEPDGTFELLLTGERPVGYEGNWVKLDERVNYILIRMITNAPDEVNGRVAIERTDARPPITPFDAEHFHQQTERMLRYMQMVSKIYAGGPRKQLEQGNVNKIEELRFGVGQVQGQAYFEGVWKLGPDEALLIEFELGRYFFWNIQLSDMLWRSLDFANCQTHLNGHLDRADSDGVIRIVVAHRDPGVLNWLDTTGLLEGDILMRFIEVDQVPRIRTRRVPLAALDRQLPSDTARCSPAQRVEDLRARRIGYQLRRHGW